MIMSHEQALVPSHSLLDEFSTHWRPEQQPIEGEQAWPRPEQVEPVWQVPEVAPPGMAQDRPMQQSPLVVQMPPCGWQLAGGTQTLPLQIAEQQEAGSVHAVPLPRQGGGVPASGVVPASVEMGGGGYWQA